MVPTQPRFEPTNQGRILVDGSNVLFWRAEQADPHLPELVVQALLARRFRPVVFFDNSIHHHMTTDALNMIRAKVEVVLAPSGTPADQLLLDACNGGRHQIVSLDRFRAWRTMYPRLQNDWLVTGRIEKAGRVSFSKKLRPVPL